MKKEIRNKKRIMKSCVAAALTLVLVLGGISIVPNKEMDTVEASDATSTYVWGELTYQEEAPICTTEGYFFGGWYEADKETPVVSPVGGTTYWAKFVPANVMSVKCQVTSGTDATTPLTALRIITTVDSLDYKEVGFDVTFNLNGTPKTKRCSTTSVLKAINVDSSGAGVYQYSPNIFDIASCYYTTITITGITDGMHQAPFLIEPYWITADGTEVQGISRYMRVEDSYNGYINVPVYLNDVAEIGSGTSITVTRKFWAGVNPVANAGHQYTYQNLCDVGQLVDSENISVSEEGNVITISITGGENVPAKGLLVNLRYKPRDGFMLSGIQSRHLFDMEGTDGTNSVKVLDVLHRNLLSKDSGDASWAKGTEEVVVISTVAELRGLQSAGNLSGKTVKLAADLDLNPSWDANSTTTPKLTWTPVASLAGTLDGQGHSIKGLHVNGASTDAGLYVKVESGATVKNLNIDNAYIAGGSKKAGTVAGTVVGIVENVEISNSILSATDNSLGAVAGDFTGRATDVVVANCSITGTNNSTGGFAGHLPGKVNNVIVQDSTITSSYFAGGVAGSSDTGGEMKGVQVNGCTLSGDQTVGGVIAESYIPISDVRVDDVTISGARAGGVAGRNRKSITNAIVQDATVSGQYSGGVVGIIYTGARVETAYSDATVTATGTSGTGGIVGLADGATDVVMTDCWYAGQLSGYEKIGGIIGYIKGISQVTIEHCQNTGEIEAVAGKTGNGIGGLVGQVEGTPDVTIKDSLAMSKFTNNSGQGIATSGSMFGYLSGTGSVIINASYGMKSFRNLQNDENVSTGWSRSGYVAKQNLLTIDGTSITKTGGCSVNYETELDIRFNRTSKGEDTLSLSFDKGDETNYWWIKTGDSEVPRLKSFADMEFKRAQFVVE